MTRLVYFESVQSEGNELFDGHVDSLFDIFDCVCLVVYGNDIHFEVLCHSSLKIQALLSVLICLEDETGCIMH